MDERRLARGLDPEIGTFPPNIYVFHYFEKLTDENGYERPEYAVSTTDSHPNASATELVAPQFVNEIFSAAIAYEQGGPTLSLSPGALNVSASAGSTDIAVFSNTIWTASSSTDWCTVTSTGFGNGIVRPVTLKTHLKHGQQPLLCQFQDCLQPRLC